MADDITSADLTLGEKARLGALVARMAKRGMAGPGVDISDLQRKVERIERQAAKRKQQGK
ncbi:hypothetical protein CJI59_13920 [Streptomyces sp. Alain-F2R5]|nr:MULTISPECIES: DUF6257 family protein [unclassified Streptomyces]PAK25800.1 hypothetical protein CJD44_14325 [Streptomyces sp. alain-838]PAN01015.1 hypothetical protein CJI59_13920 [Streptomyces sp. Alain-F2R5]